MTPSLVPQPHAVALPVNDHAPRRRPSACANAAPDWAGLGMWSQEMKAWIRALDVDGAATAAVCARWGLAVASLGRGWAAGV